MIADIIHFLTKTGIGRIDSFCERECKHVLGRLLIFMHLFNYLKTVCSPKLLYHKALVGLWPGGPRMDRRAVTSSGVVKISPLASRLAQRSKSSAEQNFHENI